MTYEYSCGAVVFTRIDGVPHYLLIRQNDQSEGCHGFPKGHMEPGETEAQTALREIWEEVGLRVRLIEGFRAVEDYGLPGGTSGEGSDCQCRRCKTYGFDPWVRKIPWRRAWKPTSVFLPRKFHG